jgi:phosphopantothenoylcysteine decarboxylase / phosphopantothenate---cysteine ligase
MAAPGIKKQVDSFMIKMIKNTGILLEFGSMKTRRQVSAGSALETENELAHASAKLWKKNFDMVVVNSANDANAGFGYDTNKITILKKTAAVSLLH